MTYEATHLALSRTRGAASNHRCIGCPDQARHWAYQHTDPNEQTDSRGRRYGAPEHYAPMCGRCHRRLDRPAATAHAVATAISVPCDHCGAKVGQLCKLESMRNRPDRSVGSVRHQHSERREHARRHGFAVPINPGPAQRARELAERSKP